MSIIAIERLLVRRYPYPATAPAILEWHRERYEILKAALEPEPDQPADATKEVASGKQDQESPRGRTRKTGGEERRESQGSAVVASPTAGDSTEGRQGAVEQTPAVNFQSQE